MSQLLDDLKALKKLLRAKKRWTKFAIARKPNHGGRACQTACHFDHPDAQCWCLIGGARKVTGFESNYYRTHDRRTTDVLHALEERLLPHWRHDIPNFNDAPHDDAREDDGLDQQDHQSRPEGGTQVSKTEQDPIYRIIEHAGEVIKRGWTQGHFAIDKYGNIESVSSDDACAFCFEGAMHRAAMELALAGIEVTSRRGGYAVPAWVGAMDFVEEDIRNLGLSIQIGSQFFEVVTLVTFNDNVAQSADAVLAVIESAKERREKELNDAG